jgi:hypothetical protein
LIEQVGGGSLVKKNEPPAVWFTETLFMIKDTRVVMCVYDKRAANYDVILINMTVDEYRKAMATRRATVAGQAGGAATQQATASTPPPAPQWKLKDAKVIKQVDFKRLKEIISKEEKDKKGVAVAVGGALSPKGATPVDLSTVPAGNATPTSPTPPTPTPASPAAAAGVIAPTPPPASAAGGPGHAKQGSVPNVPTGHTTPPSYNQMAPLGGPTSPQQGGPPFNPPPGAYGGPGYYPPYPMPTPGAPQGIAGVPPAGTPQGAPPPQGYPPQGYYPQYGYPGYPPMDPAAAHAAHQAHMAHLAAQQQQPGGQPAGGAAPPQGYPPQQGYYPPHPGYPGYYPGYPPYPGGTPTGAPPQQSEFSPVVTSPPVDERQAARSNQPLNPNGSSS